MENNFNLALSMINAPVTNPPSNKNKIISNELDINCDNFIKSCKESKQVFYDEINEVILNKLIDIKKSIDDKNYTQEKINEFAKIQDFVNNNTNLIDIKIKKAVNSINTLSNLLSIINESLE